MRPTLPSPLLLQLSELVAAQTGLYFPQERWGDLERGIVAAAADFNLPDREACANWLLSAPLNRHINEVLASHLSVGETYFFREKQSLGIFEGHILPELLQLRRRNNERRLRIWSAGCCTGEEAYTVAILLDKLVPDIKEWNITILATDFNPKFLRKAAQGVYGEWSFRDAPDWLRERYFTRTADGHYEILPRIAKMVSFSYLNFADDIYPSLSNNTGAMDVIFCRNVMMYFTAHRAKRVTENFYRALVDGGWLIVSPSETSSILFSLFNRIEFPGAVLSRKMVNVDPQPRTVEYPATPVTPAKAIETELKDWPPASEERIEPVATVMDADGHDVPAGQPTTRQPEEPEKPARMARNCANQGRLSEAQQWCEKAIAEDKMNPAHHYLLATILNEQGQHDIAIQTLIRALYLDPMFVLAHFALGNLHQSQGRYREAQRYFGNVLLLLRKHPQDYILPEAEGLTAGRLAEIVSSMLESLPQSAVAGA